MTYNISEASKRSGLSIYTLRYYDKMGLLPFINRSSSGIRKFKESDFEWLSIITCLKETGMPIKEIKNFLNLCIEGDNTLKERLEIFIEQKKKVAEEIKNLEKHMEKIDYKICYYKNAIAIDEKSIV